tara:strand:+ start:13 stop:753 length:741 start_codon:yes stop_codon:yes gene_type:complete
MAISIDTVYQTILNVANKEQRGYVTPQEFNLYANQAQMDIFEQYFYDINQFSRAPGSDNEYSDMLSILEEKLLPFKKFNQPMASIANTNELTLPANVYRLGAVFKTNNPDSYKIEVSEVQEPELQRLFRTSLLKPTDANPVYVRTTTAAGLGVLKMHPSATIPAYSITNVTCDFITKPTSVNWNYTEINGVAMYNSSTSVDFSLHASEEADLVFKILQLVGISIEAMDLYQVASQEEIKDIQQEKQ